MDVVVKSSSSPSLLSSSWLGPELKAWQTRNWKQQHRATGTSTSVIKMRDRSKNRKPLQRGRNLSIEAIQAIQALKRANQNHHNNINSLEQVFDSKFRRLLKFDMMAVLRELLRQKHCLLALKVFEDIRKEDWYKPQVSLYADMIQVFAESELFEHVQLVYLYLKSENCLEPEIVGFNALFRSLMSFNLTGLVMDCYDLMKSVDCEPNRTSFRILINGLDGIAEEEGSSAILKQDALKIYGDLEFLKEEEEEEIIVTKNGLLRRRQIS
ncbi:hypothetical protein LWI28_022225 [Acer negundo]|uniref:Pentatricopeptide repeat-containing protein n=1 Tax=Acer negundo TaxID=4023 RepID=A0AAD5J0I7_ACENE|nr:hypothetical protein LWI28_022225 [Acer negundo]KAK4848497.1 hypothetical protein QYF36_013822 [Acer negundo]